MEQDFVSKNPQAPWNSQNCDLFAVNIELKECFVHSPFFVISLSLDDFNSSETIQ